MYFLNTLDMIMESFFGFFTSSSKSTENVESTSTNTFTTQEDIITKANPGSSETGICSQLSNMYVREQITGRDHEFLHGSPERIYQDATDERAHQEEFAHEGADPYHSAFVDTQTDYKMTVIPKTGELTNDRISGFVENSNNTIITYPVGTNDAGFFHQVAVGRDKDEGCYSFSANFEGGSIHHSCEDFSQIVAEIEKIGDLEKPALVAYETGNNFNRKP